MKELLAKILAPATEAGNLSIGRTMLILCFVFSMWKWSHGADIPDTQLTILMTLLGYVLGTKVISGIRDVMTNINETKKAISGKSTEQGE